MSDRDWADDLASELHPKDQFGPKSCGTCYVDPAVHLQKIAAAARRHAAPWIAELERETRRIGLQDGARQTEARCAKLEKVVEAARIALDVLVDAQAHIVLLCLKDKAHDHSLLRRIQATVPLLDAPLAALDSSPEKEKANG